ncbi:MAG: sulfatase-like hydrolase/transferase [Bacteroidetes bacterium]|nr:sulfatase-like hydrolase/transferase [Bacteroidota bacterium]
MRLSFYLFVFSFIFTQNLYSQKQPNVIVILTDDQGAVDLNIYGAKDLYTPNMDRIAKEGTMFTQFYAGAPVCSPSRAALLTGKTNLKAGLEGNVPVPEYADRWQQYGLPSSEITLAEMLKKNGYYTALIGKWHLGHRPENLPNAQGFDYFFGHQRGCIDNYSHTFYWDGPNKHDLYRNVEEVYYDGIHFSDLMVDEIKQIIDTKKTEPFFIYWAFNAPHYPYQGTKKWLDYYKDLPTPRKEYAAFISNTDEKIGAVLDYLEQHQLREDTIIIFQSDHGHSIEERAFWGGGSAGIYRGSKFSLFEGGIRVPALISYPKKLPKNQTVDVACIEMDWFATLAALTQTPITETIDGQNLLPLIENPKLPSPHKVMHWQFGSYDDSKAQWAIRKGDWKLIGNLNEPRGKNQKNFKADLFLVNLNEDPREQHNLVDQKPQITSELLELHQKWLKEVKTEKGI